MTSSSAWKEGKKVPHVACYLRRGRRGSDPQGRHQHSRRYRRVQSCRGKCFLTRFRRSVTKFPQKIDETLAGVKETVNNLTATSEQVRQTVADFTGPDQKGVTAAENLRESLSHVNTAAANMADDTEALKHNFFLRGFFRSRGYFNLDRLSPDLYRKDRTFSRPDDRRAWLHADELFQVTADGAEQLTQKGRTLLNVTVGQYGASILQSPLVIEGYSDTTDAAQRLAISRTRAILVRNYLRNHFPARSEYHHRFGCAGEAARRPRSQRSGTASRSSSWTLPSIVNRTLMTSERISVHGDSHCSRRAEFSI